MKHKERVHENKRFECETCDSGNLYGPLFWILDLAGCTPGATTTGEAGSATRIETQQWVSSDPDAKQQENILNQSCSWKHALRFLFLFSELSEFQKFFNTIYFIKHPLSAEICKYGRCTAVSELSGSLLMGWDPSDGSILLKLKDMVTVESSK